MVSKKMAENYRLQGLQISLESTSEGMEHCKIDFKSLKFYNWTLYVNNLNIEIFSFVVYKIYFILITQFSTV